MKLAVSILVVLVLVAIAVVAVGTWRWNRATRTLVSRLASGDGRAEPSPPRVSLPAPVARYFDTVLADEPSTARYARLTQVGEFRLGEADDSWRPFRATQHVDMTEPGFVWDARIEMAPFLTVRVRDAYVDGEGSMLGKVLAVATVVDAHDEIELSSGALLRYLAEAVWFPSALRPSERLQWRAIDDHTAAATLSDAGIEVTATFHFNDAGEITGVSAERYREVDGSYVLTPWRGRFRSYAARGAHRIPLEGEVGWVLAGGEHVYWRGEIADIRFDPR